MTEVPVPRQHVRYPVRLRVDYTTRDAFVANHVSNLSKGGLFIASDAPLPVDSELELILTLAEPAECIRARGRVIWNYDIRKGTSRVIPGMGIKFLDMSTADRHRLADYLSALRPPLGAAAGTAVATQGPALASPMQAADPAKAL